jgi:pyruvate/2-oxoglutarate dehydrogenase complex dihydrolipoamide acyltransferase (E2) component
MPGHLQAAFEGLAQQHAASMNAIGLQGAAMLQQQQQTMNGLANLGNFCGAVGQSLAGLGGGVDALTQATLAANARNPSVTYVGGNTTNQTVIQQAAFQQNIQQNNQAFAAAQSIYNASLYGVGGSSGSGGVLPPVQSTSGGSGAPGAPGAGGPILQLSGAVPHGPQVFAMDGDDSPVASSIPVNFPGTLSNTIAVAKAMQAGAIPHVAAPAAAPAAAVPKVAAAPPKAPPRRVLTDAQKAAAAAKRAARTVEQKATDAANRPPLSDMQKAKAAESQRRRRALAAAAGLPPPPKQGAAKPPPPAPPPPPKPPPSAPASVALVALGGMKRADRIDMVQAVEGGDRARMIAKKQKKG